MQGPKSDISNCIPPPKKKKKRVQTLRWSLDSEGFSKSVSVIIARLECAHLQLTRAKLIHFPRSPDSVICSLIEPGETFEPRLLFLTLQRIRVYWSALTECFSRDPQRQTRKTSLWHSLHTRDPREAFPWLRAVVFAAQKPESHFCLVVNECIVFSNCGSDFTSFFPCLSLSDATSPIFVLEFYFCCF